MKSMHMNLKNMLAVSALALAIPLSAQAHNHSGGEKAGEKKEYRHGHHGMGVLGKLDLTEAQQAQVKTIMQQQREQMKGERGQYRENRQALQQLVEQENFDRQRASELIAANQEKQRAMKLQMLQTQHEIYKVLTPEQREKAKTIRAEYREKRMERYKERKQGS